MYEWVQKKNQSIWGGKKQREEKNPKSLDTELLKGQEKGRTSKRYWEGMLNEIRRDKKVYIGIFYKVNERNIQEVLGVTVTNIADAEEGWELTTDFSMSSLTLRWAVFLSWHKQKPNWGTSKIKMYSYYR